jgi:hypothetical protein
MNVDEGFVQISRGGCARVGPPSLTGMNAPTGFCVLAGLYALVGLCPIIEVDPYIFVEVYFRFITSSPQ